MEGSNLKIMQKNFGWIKKQLDPSKGYVIFENDLNKQACSVFSDSLFAFLKQENYKFKQVFDPEKTKEYLVIQSDPGKEDETLGKIMGYGLSKDIVTYLYKAEIQK